MGSLLYPSSTSHCLFRIVHFCLGERSINSETVAIEIMCQGPFSTYDGQAAEEMAEVCCRQIW